MEQNHDILLLEHLTSKGLITTQHRSYLLLHHACTQDDITSVILTSGFTQDWELVESVARITQTSVFQSEKFKSLKGKYAELRTYCNQGWIEYESTECSGILVKTLNLQIIEELKALHPRKQIFICTLQEFFSLLERKFQAQALAQAKSFVRFINISTSRDLKYGLILLASSTMGLACFIAIPFAFHLANVCVTICQNIFKNVLLLAAIFKASSRQKAETKYFTEYPIYTVLIPAYREANLGQILDAISRFFYPKHKLDVKLLIEEDDSLTKLALEGLKLPHYVHLLQVPASNPRTKPKAMNYAMPYALGHYITVYDAEDIPEPFQLITALDSFNELPLHYICLQAKLRFYNMRENLLTKMMSLEYGVLFNFLIYGLSIINLPVPLGGTSNHFRTAMLWQVGWWDAYNVAEDADLGMRIFAHNYKVAVMDSFTSEEAPISLIAWLKQRSRWIKGYWQTFFVFCKHRHKYSFKQSIGVYNFLGFATYSQLVFPLAFILLFVAKDPKVRFIWKVSTAVGLSYTLFAAAIGIRKIKLAQKWYEYPSLIICYSAYFGLHFLASIIAITELALAPFSWNKTQHGLSKVMQKTNDKLKRGKT